MASARAGAVAAHDWLGRASQRVVLAVLVATYASTASACIQQADLVLREPELRRDQYCPESVPDVWIEEIIRCGCECSQPSACRPAPLGRKAATSSGSLPEASEEYRGDYESSSGPSYCSPCSTSPSAGPPRSYCDGGRPASFEHAYAQQEGDHGGGQHCRGDAENASRARNLRGCEGTALEGDFGGEGSPERTPAGWESG